ncbi:MAG: 2'-5' RNA ligase [uncultured Chloroflexi bacterium]|uniref:RNA 2',3'-cyclic phosphodiesterase n=1 Tax=uncultured Chloroflexota bacterium TaxID=166587 RepID=A0A6J4IGQ8_9CHLR|nr:MAG: 2'-5' RNA ligase [uncultured Chloroflexota bacterium]
MGGSGSIHSLPVPPVRLFIALPLPEEVRANLAAAQAGVSRLRLPLRFARAEGLHLTLAFLGETVEERLPALRSLIDEAAAPSPAILLTVRGLGVFPNPRRPRVLWAGLEGDLSQLVALYDRLGGSLAAAGFPVEDRPFRPHVTLGRVSGEWTPETLRLLHAKLAETPEPFGAWRAETLDLMLSELRREGARYATLHTSALGRVAGSR